MSRRATPQVAQALKVDNIIVYTSVSKSDGHRFKGSDPLFYNIITSIHLDVGLQ